MNEDILAAAIVEKAAKDFRQAILPTSTKKKDWVGTVCRKRTRLNELRRFFRSANADVFSGGNAQIILRNLEREYQQSMGRLQIEAYERGEIG